MDLLIDEELNALKAGKQEGARWAVYVCDVLDSAELGMRRFLLIGPTCTFKEPPHRMPDTPRYIGWKYGFVGWANLETREIDAP